MLWVQHHFSVGAVATGPAGSCAGGASARQFQRTLKNAAAVP